MFKWLLESSLANRLLVLIAAAVLMAYGAFTLTRTPVDVFPDLNKPTVTIMTEAGGMAAEEVEQLITFPLETTMNGLPGVESIRSTSSAGLSFIYVTFDWSTEIFRARQMVSERLTSMEEGLPEGITPRMGPISSIMGEIMQVAIPIEAAKMSPMAVREYADWVLRPRLMAIPGVAQVIPIGGEVRQFQVQPNTVRMAELDITHEQLEGALRGFSSNSSGGFLELNGREYLIRHLGRTSRLDDLKNLALTARNGQAIRLRQIADVSFAPALKRGDAGFEGKPAVILGIQKQPTADTIGLTRTIEAALGEMKTSLPAGMEAPRVTFRQASFIEASVTTLQGKLMGASVFVAVILFVFLGTLRPTIIALTAIPVSIFVTALVFRYFGLSINTMTLGGLAIAIGGLVDDAVVDVENVLRRLKLERQKPEAERMPMLEVVKLASMEGGAIGHPVRNGHHRPGVPALVCAAWHRGALVRAPGHCVHRLDPGFAAGLGHGDAGSGLLPVATHEEPGPRRHPRPGLAESALPQGLAGRADGAEIGIDGRWGGGGVVGCGGAFLCHHLSAAVQ